MSRSPSRVADRRSPSLAALLSFLWPGLGQLYAGRRWAAVAFGVPAIALALLTLRELLGGPIAFALGMVSSSYALAVLTAIVLFGVWRIAAVAHAWIAGRGPVASRADASALALLLAAIVAMHAIPSWYAWSAYSFDTAISRPTDAPNGPIATPDPSQAPVMATPTPGAEPTESEAPWLHGNRETIVLTGVDSGPGRSQALTDTMMIVSLDTTSKKVAMVSVPRDTTMFPLYWNRATLGPTFKLNAFVTGLRNGWYKAPDDPMTAFKKELGFIVGVQIDYYAALDLTGFPPMIDMVGGVDVVNPKAFFDPLQNRQWAAGRLHLNGADALLYVRSRYGDNDYRRAARQQDVMVALQKKLATPAMILQLPAFLDLAARYLHTDYPLEHVRDMASLAMGLGDADIAECVLGPPYSWHPDSGTTNGVWTSRLDMDRVAALSKFLFGDTSRYRASSLAPAACAN